MVAEIASQLASITKGKSFAQVLSAFGIQMVREDAEGQRIPEAQTMAKGKPPPTPQIQAARVVVAARIENVGKYQSCMLSK